MNDVAGLLGEAVGSTLLWWPISFSAVKGSLKLTYRWQPFLQGWLVSVVVLATLLMIAQSAFELEAQENKMGVALFSVFLFPIAVCVFVAFAFRKKFIPSQASTTNSESIAAIQRTPSSAKRSNSATGGLARSSVAWCWRSFKRMPEPWLAGLTLLGLLCAAAFPPWVSEFRGYRKVLGYGSILSPPETPYGTNYSHIDYALLIAECIGIAALGGISILVAHIWRRNQ